MDNVVTLDNFRKKPVEKSEAKTHFADDLVADHMANDLVHSLLATFVAETGADLDDIAYAKTVEAMVVIARMMTRRHMGVFDTHNALLDRDENSGIMIGVDVINEEEFDV